MTSVLYDTNPPIPDSTRHGQLIQLLLSHLYSSLDPSHFPSSSSSSHDDDRLHGQAVHQTVSAAPETSSKHHHHHQQIPHEPVPTTPSEPSWTGAWAHRQAAKREQQLERERKLQLHDDDEDGKIKDGFDPLSLLEKVGLPSKEEIKIKDQRIPVPPIPDLRYEQGILMSIRPFLHRVQPKTPTTTTNTIPTDSETILVGEDTSVLPSDRSPAHQERHEERKKVEEKTAMVSSALTAEAAKEGLKEGEETDLFAGPLRLEWGNIVYVIFRDQFIYPLLQGLVWGAGGLWIASLWEWNKSRSAASNATRAASVNKGVSPVSTWLAKFGLKARS